MDDPLARYFVRGALLDTGPSFDGIDAIYSRRGWPGRVAGGARTQGLADQMIRLIFQPAKALSGGIPSVDAVSGPANW